MITVSYEDFIASLPPKLRKSVQTVSQVENKIYPTASYGLNWALNGGIGAGRMTVLYGSSGAGKSLLMLQSIAQWQKQGLVCLYVDAEGTVTKEFAQRLGVNTDELIYISERGFGPAVDAMMPYVEAGVDIVVVDTFSDMIPDQFVEDDGKAKTFDNAKQLGAHAKSTTRMINLLMYSLKSNTALILLSQTTTKIETWGTMQIPHGGQKVEFAASQIIKLVTSRADNRQIHEDVWVGDSLIKQPVGRHVDATVTKNKFGPELRIAKWDIYWAGKKLGLDLMQERIELAIKYGVIASSTSWLTWKEQKIQGRSKLQEYFESNPEEFKQLEDELEMAMLSERTV